MSTDIAVTKIGDYQAVSRAWLASLHGTEYTPNVHLDLTLFSGLVNANGYVPTGIILAKHVAESTTTPTYGPYTHGDTNLGTAAGILWNYLTIGATPSAGANDAMLVHGFVYAAKLPIASGSAGGLDTDARTALKNIIFI